MKPFFVSIAIMSSLLAANAAAAAGRNACPDGPPGKWAAWVDAMPSTTGPKLHVKGQVVTPTAGYSLRLRAVGPTGRKPFVQTLELIMRPPSGMAAQVVSTHEVGFSAKAPPMQRPWNSPFKAVRIVCDGRLVTVIEPVTVTH